MRLQGRGSVVSLALLAAALAAGSARAAEVGVATGTWRAPVVSPAGTLDPLPLAMRLIPVMRALVQERETLDPKKPLLLQTPFRCFVIPARDFARYKRGDPAKLIQDEGRLIYPVVDPGGALVSSIHLKKENGLWTEEGYDDRKLAQALREARQERASLADAPEFDGYFLVVVFVEEAKRVGFLGEYSSGKGERTLLLTTLFDEAALPKGRTLPAEQALKALKKGRG